MKKKLFFTFPSSIRKGFTLIELLVVIAIVGILTSVLMVNFIGVRQRARDAQRKTQMKQLQSAFEVYRSDTGSYPCFVSGCGPGSTKPVANLTSVLGSYLSDDIIDPLQTGDCPNYLVSVSATGANYTIYAKLENANDIDATTAKKAPVSNAGVAGFSCINPSGAVGKCTTYSTATGCSATYNYWVNNP